MENNFPPKLTGHFCLGHVCQSEPFPRVELRQVGAAPFRPGHRARCGAHTHQHTQEHRETHLLKSSPFFPLSHSESPEDLWSAWIKLQFLEDPPPSALSYLICEEFFSLSAGAEVAPVQTARRAGSTDARTDRGEGRGGQSWLVLREKRAATRGCRCQVHAAPPPLLLRLLLLLVSAAGCEPQRCQRQKGERPRERERERAGVALYRFMIMEIGRFKGNKRVKSGVFKRGFRQQKHRPALRAVGQWHAPFLSFSLCVWTWASVFCRKRQGRNSATCRSRWQERSVEGSHRRDPGLKMYSIYSQ